MTLRKDRDWGEPVNGPVDFEVAGNDAALAAAAHRHPGALVAFRPTGSDLARALGLGESGPGEDARAPAGLALPLDGIALDGATVPFALNLVVVGTSPAGLRATTRSTDVRVCVDGRELHRGPATTVVVASGQFLGTADVVPRGHPGDGRLEVQVYALARRERRALRARLPTGNHVPHPRIATGSGRAVEVTVDGRALPVLADGHPAGAVTRLGAAIVPGAIRLLV
ncbi:MAG: hypothetical protein FJW88_05130 [Actinobacteria bacterium]|nr:hypothetical protein [Actinomycetota bacterium]